MFQICRECVRQSQREIRKASTKVGAELAAARRKLQVWEPVFQPGQYPVYDQALEYIKRDTETKLNKVQELQSQLEGKEENQRSRLQKQIEILEANALVNDPETRWNFMRSKSDFSKPVYRLLHDQTWRKNGDLAMLVDNLKESNVFPDVLPHTDVTVDLVMRQAGTLRPIKPNTLITPETTVVPLELEVRIPHSEERLYTLALVDSDVADEVTETYSTYCHYLAHNLALSPTNDKLTFDVQDAALFPYIPPHPQEGTKIHRYVFVLMEQPHEVQKDDFKREGFDLRGLISDYSLKVVGINFFRQRWSPAVTDIYSRILKTTEPKYAHRPGKIEYVQNRKVVRKSIKVANRIEHKAGVHRQKAYLEMDVQ